MPRAIKPPLLGPYFYSCSTGTSAIPLPAVPAATPATMFWCGVSSTYNSKTCCSSFVSTLNIKSYWKQHEGKGTCRGLSWSSSSFSAFSPTPPFALALSHFGLLHGRSHLQRWQNSNAEQNNKERAIICQVRERKCLKSGPMRSTRRTGTIGPDLFGQEWRIWQLSLH